MDMMVDRKCVCICWFVLEIRVGVDSNRREGVIKVINSFSLLRLRSFLGYLVLSMMSWLF